MISVCCGRYPWGAEWDSNRANTTESGLVRTTAVGLYPQGASPVAAFDMSGNVEEWCLNERDKPHRIKETGEARRAVRGGSWINFHDHALYAYRFNYNPRNRSIISVFVCCVRPPSS